MTTEERSSKFPSFFCSLISNSLKEFKRLHFIADESTELLTELRLCKTNGVLPKILQIKPPRIFINDAEANALLASEFEAIQAEANKGFLDAYIAGMEIAVSNHVSAIEAAVEAFYSSLRDALDSLKGLPFVGNYTPPTEEWFKEVKADFEAKANNFLVEKAVDKALKQFARDQDAEAMRDADQIPEEKYVDQQVDEMVNEMFSPPASVSASNLPCDQNSAQGRRRRRGRGQGRRQG